MAAVSSAFVSPLLTMRVVAQAHGWSRIAAARARPRSLRPHCGTGTAGSTTTSGCVT